MSNIYPKQYKSKLSLVETQDAIVEIKGHFQSALSTYLGLKRVSAPIFVDPKTGLNDNLSGTEKAVGFETVDGTTLEIVQSLAKWKRFALKTYGISGLFTDMNAIRKNEYTDNMHSIYVDQWDWEKVILKEERTIEYLKEIVNKIYRAIKETSSYIQSKYSSLKRKLADEVTFITSEELLNLYPALSSKDREREITKKYGSVFVIGIGAKLKDGSVHDLRASDYDDWDLNGDLLLYDDILDIAFEITSMGIRVDSKSLQKQLKETHEEFKFEMPYHKAIANEELSLTIGGGIGQSRLCMYLLEKAHIGEVQSSYWLEEDKKELEKFGIKVL